MYDKTMIVPFIISFILFFLYMILQLINLNTFVKGLDVLDVGTTTRGTFVYAYLIGYFAFFLKLTLNLLTLAVIITMIVWIIVAISQLIAGKSMSGGYNSAAEFRGGASTELGEKMQGAAISVIKYVMGIYFTKNFFILYAVVLPIFLLFFSIMFVQFYDRDIIQNKNENKASSITITNHNYMIMVITTLVVFIAITIFYQYAKEVILDQD